MNYAALKTNEWAKFYSKNWPGSKSVYWYISWTGSGSGSGDDDDLSYFRSESRSRSNSWRRE